MLAIAWAPSIPAFSSGARPATCRPTALRTSSLRCKKGEEAEDSPYRASVLLPHTSFSQRANALTREPELQKFWADEQIYAQLSASNPGEPFVLHDGPPYANGELHMGHALNKILKDIVNRYMLLQGRKVAYIPGWDCHGLPIELKVLQAMKSSERRELTPLQLRKRAAGFARETMASQRDAFMRYGVWGHFDAPYLTLQPEYEAAQLRVFGQMYLKGHIYRGRKPVHWSPSSRTALAEAELEYPEKHTSASIYVGFQVVSPSPALEPYQDGLRVAIWTTTPWTIPANLAVAVNGALEYSVASHPSLSFKLLVAKDLIGAVSGRLGLPDGESLTEEATFKGEQVAGTTYAHPLLERTSEVVLGGDYITTESGTGLVHTAPGHGQDDYLTGQKYGLPLLSPVDDAGRFTEEAGERFVGMDVLSDGNREVISALAEAGALLCEEAYEHKYPYDWRTKKPTIFRATSQWFASVDAFREEALRAIGEVRWMPELGRNRITTMTQSRSDWCISRQRTWGVPIPVFYHRQTDEVLLNAETLAHAERIIAEKGADAWWELSEKELLPAPYCDSWEDWAKGTDTMDVWFDSGSSWASVVQQREALHNRYPADLYLEGSDQHRGWFQSSLLTSVAVNGIAPYKAVLTHGFVLDEKGYKMSKSLGNVMDPKLVIEGGKNKKTQPPYGADVLRLWVSSVNYASDVCIGESIIKQCFDSYRKLRNTARYLLGNLHDFDPSKDTVALDALPALDKYMLAVLAQFTRETKLAYDGYAFSRVFNLLQQFAVTDLSSFYLDLAKDRLYISAPDDPRRRSCQTVLAAVLEGLVAAMAPILPHMAEDIWQALPYASPHKSAFQNGWPQPDAPQVDEEEWAALRACRDQVNKCIEAARVDKALGASLEAKVLLHTDDPTLQHALQKYAGGEARNGVDELRFIFLTSQVEVLASADEVHERSAHSVSSKEPFPVSVGVAPADGTKCERCWHYSPSVAAGAGGNYPGVCSRCAGALEAMEFPAVGVPAITA
ncbi:hypothetical protein AB1Y20_015614 [Prymnesium parvum]|uniref:isoleucine--tRNA ligase n=1 Tax=Prymnesium parvum TaxID=97485 RepID=A0AB34JXM8_PRYPA